MTEPIEEAGHAQCRARRRKECENACLKPKCAVIMKWNKGRVDRAMEEEALRGFIKAKVVLEVDVGWIRGIDRLSC